MRATYHFVVSLALSLCEWCNGRFVSGVLCLVLGWLVDADHEIDYYLYAHTFIDPIRLSRVIEELSISEKRIYLLLHGYEWLVIGLVIGVPIIPMLSYAIHLVMDIVGNGVRPLQMSVIIRALNKWDARKIKVK